MTNRTGGGGVSSKPLKGRLGGGGVDTITRTVKVQYRYELSDMDVHCEGRFGALCSKERVLIVNLDSPESVTGTLSCRGPHGAALVRWNHSRPGPHFVAATVHQNVVVWDVSRFGHVGSTGDPATAAAAAAPPPTGQSIIAHARAVSELCWSPHEEALFATVSADMFLNLWDLRDGRKGVQNLKHLKTFGGALRGVRWNPLNAKTLAVVHDSGDVRIWDLRMDSSVPTAHFLVPGKASSLDWSPKREHEFLTSSQDTPAVHFWSTQSASSKPHRTLVPPTPLHKAVYTSFGDGVVTASRSREAEAQALQLWRLSDLALLHSFSGHTGRVRAVAFRHRGSFVHQLVSLGEDKTLRMWPIDTALQQGCAQPPRDAADASSSPSDLPSRVVHSSDRHLDLEQEFAILRTLAPRILGCRVAETSTLRRTCVLVVQLTPGAVPGCGRDTVVHLKVILPLHYPNGAAPSFELMADSKISPRVRMALRDALNATAQELVAKSTPCLIQCVAVMVPELLSLHSQKQQQHRVAVILSGEMGHHTTTEDESASDDLLSSSLHDMASGNQSAEAVATPFPRLRRVSWVGNDRLLVLNPSGHLRGISFRHSKGETLRCRTYAEFQQLLLARITDFSSRAHEPVDLPPLHTAQGVGSSSLLPGRSSSMLPGSGLDPSASGRSPLPGKFATFSKFSSPGKASGAQSEAPAAALRTPESYTSLNSLSLAADNDISRLFEDEEDHRMDDASDMIDFSAIPQPFASHGVIFDASELLLLNATLAAGYAVLFSPHYPAHAASAGPHGASVSQICSHNAQLAASAHRQDLVQTWGILSGVTGEIERVLTISGEGGGGGSRGNWHAHPFGRLLVTQILEHYMRLRDLQTVAMIVAVLVVNSALYSDRSSRSHGHHPFKKTKYAFGLLGKAGIQRYDAVRHLYAEALRRYGLDHLAAQVTKFTKATELPMSTPKIAFCSACNVRIGGIRKFCRSCQYAAPSCALCDLPVRGLSLCCPLCGHGGHVDHLRSWFASRSSCPTACGCNCSLA